MIVKILLGVICVLVLIILFGCVEPTEEIDYDSIIVEKETQLAVANLKIIELQESTEYLRKQKETAENKFDDIELVYSDLFTDASTCYYANLCSYDDWACVESLKDLYPGYTADELYVMESDWCDGMIRDWEKYQSYDYELNEGE